jgi:HK97 gp10 family phage protein
MSDVRIEDHTAEYDRDVERALLNALEDIGLHIEGEAKEELENSPRRIDTGNLRNSITNEVVDDEKAVYIGTNVEYAIYVHEGTSRMEPNRFLKNAVARNKDQIKDYIKKALS